MGEKFVPLITTVSPGAPLPGLKPLTVGEGSSTVKVGPVAVIPFTATFTAPVVAPAGTVMVKLVVLAVVTVAAVPLKVTLLLAAVGLKFVPVMVTVAPTKPLVGLISVIVGGGITTVNDTPEFEVSPEVEVKKMGPLCAPAGTGALKLY